MCSKTPQNTSNVNKTVNMSPHAPHCCRTPQRPIPAYHTSLVSSLDTLGPTNFEFVHNRIKVSVDDLYIFCDFCIFAKVLDFEGLSMETFIRLWPILNFDSPRASNELTNEVWHVGIGRWGACHQMGPRMWILTDFQDCEISQKSANSWIY